MLVLTVKPDEVTWIGTAKVTIRRKGNNFRLSVDAPLDTKVLRSGLEPKEPEPESAVA